MDIVNRIIEAIKSFINSLFGLLPEIANWFILQWQNFVNLPVSQMSALELAAMAIFAAIAGYILYGFGKPFYHATLHVLVSLGEWVVAFFRFFPAMFAAGIVLYVGHWILTHYSF